jgi:hypothetical protein
MEASMQVVCTHDVVETKRAALFYLLACLCNDGVSLPLTEFARYCSATASTEDLIAALELHEADRAGCESWMISSEQWFTGLRQALYQHIVAAIHSETGECEIPEAAIHVRPGQC